MDFSTICRTCLGSDSLSPIFSNNKDHKPYSTAIFIVMGVKVGKNDGLPQQMCGHCIYHLNNSLSFRKKCKEVQAKLMQAKTESNPLNIAVEVENKVDIKSDDMDSLDSYMVVKPVNYDDATIKEPKQSPKNYTELKTADRTLCLICNKDLSIKSLEMHMMKNHPTADDRRTKCELCSKYIMKEKMNRHVHMMHKLRGYQCEHCNSTFQSRNSLVEHIKAKCVAKKMMKKNVIKKSREMVECEICKKKMQRASMKNHMNIKHAGLGPVCEHCGRRFGNKLRLAEHLRAKHGYEKFRCSSCEFSCSSSLALENHGRRHRGEKPFVCEACGAGFHAASLLAQHRKSHGTLRTMRCPSCPAVFKTSNTLSAHKLTVHGHSQHKCLMCSKTYSCRHYAVKHLRTVHLFKGKIPSLQVLTESSEI